MMHPPYRKRSSFVATLRPCDRIPLEELHYQLLCNPPQDCLHYGSSVCFSPAQIVALIFTTKSLDFKLG